VNLVTLRGLNPDQFSAWLESSIKGYAQANVKAGRWQQKDSIKKAEDACNGLLPQGLETPGHYIYDINSNSKTIGHVWLWIDLKTSPCKAFIYDIELLEEFRKKGLGRASMLTVESKAKELGAAILGLHVFAYNKVAHELYKKLDYSYVSHSMEKLLTKKQ